jgi:hypothetical protein
MATNRRTPVEILIHNMDVCDARADHLDEKAQAMQVLAEAAPARQRKARLAAIEKVKKEADKARMEAGKYAKAAAPYFHAKPEPLDPDTLAVETSCADRQSGEDMTAEEAKTDRKLIRRRRSGRGSS